MSTRIALTATVILASLADGCSKPATCAVPTGAPANEQSLITGNTQFAIALYGPVTQASMGNAFFSPYSISAALAMVASGAAGSTATQLWSTLGLPGTPGSGAAGTGIAAANLDCTVESDGSSNGNQIALANALFGQSGFTFEPPFLSLLKTDYAAPLQTEDFENASAAAIQTINGWVSNETAGQIQKLVSSATVDAQTRLVVVDAIYFKGTWQVEFEADNTQPAPFTTSTGDEVMPPTMNAVLPKALLGGGEDFALLEMPYAGGQLAMDIALPNPSVGLSQIEGEMTSGVLAQALASLRSASVQVSLPRFKFGQGIELSAILAGLGIVDAFEPGVADFSGMDGKLDLCLSAVVHEAILEVDEQGTTAAAATAASVQVETIVGPRGPPEPIPFIVNRPFMLLIRDVPSGSILFAGHVLNPMQ